ncbi:hypothetical protein UAY_01511 [Enterococcus moraviensis ATCC BAA-383]|uniref:DUF4003 domain-containing protein n=1 Tax=Enterococcus moraviensis ATCC BAA-383 TaxID=1158609 RepID=R2SYV4_9ENTE|nr:DUF4003 family protein [Enterococcus moraviensis]EOI00408.1 hypothetical protein UAY_01511 [Enterococcus moraviensis ATCC BAA-383]EOT73363.1 hypothetical protein I586_00356 [Enterococcus moraviensis ATCC BAA-383]
MNRSRVVELLQTNYEAIKEGKGKWFDKRVSYTIARTFVSKERLFSDSDYRRMEEVIKEELGVFNVLGQPVRGILLGMMLANGKTKELDIHTLISDYQRLREAGFLLSSYSYFSAYLLQFTEVAEKEFVVRRGQSIFEKLKARHSFLTGAEDGTIAISLAQQEKLESLTTEQVGDLVEAYYQALNDCGFFKSNQLQFAAASAAMLTGSFSFELIEGINDVVGALKQMGIRLKVEFYTSIVMLAFLGTMKKVRYEVLAEYLELIEEKTHLRFYKDFRSTLALGLLVQEEMSGLSDANLNISALTITMMMAQEASAAAAVIAISASNSSS